MSGQNSYVGIGVSGIGLNPVKETPPCINARYGTGRSSSGAGASVAFGLAPAAIGSDTGGSVRIPAAWNDLVGLKTTSGLISLEGVVPLCASFDTVGPLTKTVEDAAHIFTALTGQGAMDTSNASVSGRRLAVLKSDLFDVTREEPGKAFEETVRKFATAGAEITEITVDFLSDANAIGGPLFVGEAYGTWQREIEANPEKMFARICERFRQGKDVSAAISWQAGSSLNAIEPRLNL